MQPYFDTVLSDKGRPVVGASIVVTKKSDGAGATIYSDNGVTVLESLATDENGFFEFYAEDGRYRVAGWLAGVKIFQLNDVLLEDQASAIATAQAAAAAAQADANGAVQAGDLAASTGSTLMGHGTDTVAGVLDALQMADYTALRAYAGARKSVYVTGYLAAGEPSGIAGMFVRDDADTTSADNGGTVIVASNGKRWKRRDAAVWNAAWFDVLPIEAGASSPATTAANLESLRVAAETAEASVLVGAGTYVLPPQVRLDADNTAWTFARGAVLKLHDTQAADDFILLQSPVNQRVKGLRVDGNRAIQNAATFGADNAAVLVVDATSCLFDAPEIISSPGKGFAVVSSAGGYNRDVEIRSFKGADCATQVLIVDGNNMTGFFERITIKSVRIGATSHGGVVLNDGAHQIAMSDVIADVQNSTWDAVSIRDSYDIQMTNVRGKRGRNGIYAQRLNGFCGRIELNNVAGESNSQNGVLLAGAENVTGGTVVGRNNAAAGINITTGVASYRCKNISIAAPVGYDDQGTPTQQYGLLVQGVDGCQLGKHTAYGNTVKNVSIVRASVSAVDAQVRQVASGTTGSIAANAQAVITVNWPAAFEDASIDLEAIYVSEGTSSLALSVTHVVATTAAAVQVMVKNLSGTTAHTGTLTVIGRRAI
jgi:hypothetical protein